MHFDVINDRLKKELAVIDRHAEADPLRAVLRADEDEGLLAMWVFTLSLVGVFVLHHGH